MNKSAGLPVHRAPGKKGGTVFAYPSELDTWLESREKEQRLNLAISDIPCRTARGRCAADQLTVGRCHDTSRNLRRPTPGKADFNSPAVTLGFVAASALLVSSVALSWQFGNYRAARASYHLVTIGSIESESEGSGSRHRGFISSRALFLATSAPPTVWRRRLTSTLKRLSPTLPMRRLTPGSPNPTIYFPNLATLIWEIRSGRQKLPPTGP